MGPRKEFKLAMTFSTAFLLVKRLPNTSQFDVITTDSSPKVV
jgi:hypothetical protein